jgi:hypothetical protein
LLWRGNGCRAWERLSGLQSLESRTMTLLTRLGVAANQRPPRASTLQFHACASDRETEQATRATACIITFRMNVDFGFGSSLTLALTCVLTCALTCAALTCTLPLPLPLTASLALSPSSTRRRLHPPTHLPTNTYPILCRPPSTAYHPYRPLPLPLPFF